MKKGVIFFSVILALLFLLIFMPLAINTVTVKEAKFKNKLGESQLKLLETYDKGERVLFFIDQAGRNALYESLDTLETSCGKYNDYVLLNAKDKSCMNELGNEIEKGTNEYFKKFTEEIPIQEYEFSFGYNSLIMNSKDFIRMDIEEKYNFVNSPKEIEQQTQSQGPAPTQPNIPKTPTTPVPNGNSQDETCSYCYAYGWDKYWLPTVSQWDSSTSMVVSSSKTCFKAKCPPSTKILKVPYTNQCQYSYGAHPDAWPSSYGFGNLDACMAMCGPTSVQMLNDFYEGSFNVQTDWWRVKNTQNPNDYYGNAQRRYMPSVLGQYTGKNFYYVESASINTIKAYIDQGKPVLTGMLLGTGCPQISPYTYYCYNKMGHIWVVVGYGNGYIILNDPYTSYNVGYDTSFGNNLVLPESGVQGSFMSVWSGALVV